MNTGLLYVTAKPSVDQYLCIILKELSSVADASIDEFIVFDDVRTENASSRSDEHNVIKLIKSSTLNSVTMHNLWDTYVFDIYIYIYV